MIGVTAIVKDRLEYVIEWIEWHRFIGFDLVRLYDNDVERPLRRGLELFYGGIPPWLEIILFPGPGQQLPAYADSIAKGGVEWMAFFDIDEFLVLDGKVCELLERRTETGVGIEWLVFTANNEVVRQEGLQVERFTETLPDANRSSRKQIVRPEMVDRPGTPHWFHYKQERIWNPDRLQARLNHYCVRSYDDFTDKLARGYPDNAAPQPHLICAQGFPEGPTGLDTSILERWPADERRRLSRRIYG